MVLPLRPRDYALMSCYCLLLFCFPIFYNRTFSSHETVGCVSIREMRLDGDWVIPHYGGRPWLERPPLPFWLTQPFVTVLGDYSPVYRLPPLLVALGCVLLLGWMASVWFGRETGILAGLALATVREFTHYSTAPESDMFLCGIVTSAMALFVSLEFVRFSRWTLLAFFVVAGLANLVKGLFFGDLMIFLPIVAYLLWGSDRLERLRRYVWLPGWVAFGVAAGTWATLAYLRYPDIVDLWKSDYIGRYNRGYMQEPAWYYLVHLPWVLFPWTISAAIGLLCTWRKALCEGRTPERFVWCWALVPIAFFSIPQGKHHHYLLHLIAPWAVLAAIGVVRFWERVLSWQSTLTVRGVLIAGFVVALPLHWLGHAVYPLLQNRYADDRQFVARVQAELPDAATLVVLDDVGPLDASWMLYYLDGRAQLLHNVTFLRDEKWGTTVHVVTRRCYESQLREYGETKVLFESAHSRDESQGIEARFGLYEVRLRADLARVRGPVYFSPMQATGRAAGPVMQGPPGVARR